MNLFCWRRSDSLNHCASVPGQLQLRWIFSHSNDCTLSKDNRRTTTTKNNFKQKVQNKRSKEKLKNVSKRKSHSKQNLIIIVFLAAERLCDPSQEWRQSPERNGKISVVPDERKSVSVLHSNNRLRRKYDLVLKYFQSGPVASRPTSRGFKTQLFIKTLLRVFFFSSTSQAAHLLQYLPHRWNG